jgi:prepilin-type N-terminal cleavage/methylation domain-containing protein/prepilin-type processing-associated H-X9-DG protein
MKKKGFTLVELLVVIAIIALLLSILIPALRRARQQAQSIYCRANLKGLAIANSVYSNQNDGWMVPAVDLTMVSTGHATWNSNVLFREILALRTKSPPGTSLPEHSLLMSIMPKEYLCPTDKLQRDFTVTNLALSRVDNKENEGISLFPCWPVNMIYPFSIVSYAYNYTDWGSDSTQEIFVTGGLPMYSDEAARIKQIEIKRPAEKIMFIDAGDIWSEVDGANYKTYWDRFGYNLQEHRENNSWKPVFYRHREGANIAFADGHVEFRKKEEIFHYEKNSDSPDYGTNSWMWYYDPSHSIILKELNNGL